MTSATETTKQVKARKPRSKPARSLSIVHQEGDTIIVGITVGKTFAHYFITPMQASFGQGFQIEKQADDGSETVEPYHVNIDGPVTHCDCRGHGRHQRCKHSDAVRKLQELTLLPVAMPLPEEPGTVEVWDDTSWF